MASTQDPAPFGPDCYRFVDDVYPNGSPLRAEREGFEWHVGAVVAAEHFLVRSFNLDRVEKQWRKAKQSHGRGHEAKAALRALDAGLAVGAGAGKAASIAANALDPIAHGIPALVGAAVPILPIKIAAALWEAAGNGFLAFTRSSRGLPHAAGLRAKLGAMQAGWGLAGVAISLAAAGASAAAGHPQLAPWAGLGAGEVWGAVSRWRLDRLKKSTAQEEGLEIQELGWHEMGWGKSHPDPHAHCAGPANAARAMAKVGKP